METKTGAPANDHWWASALQIGLDPKILSMNEKGIYSKDVDWTTIDTWSIQEYENAFIFNGTIAYISV